MGIQPAQLDQLRQLLPSNVNIAAATPTTATNEVASLNVANVAETHTANNTTTPVAHVINANAAQRIATRKALILLARSRQHLAPKRARVHIHLQQRANDGTTQSSPTS